MFTFARVNLYILLATYLGSAVVLYFGRRQGRPVTWSIIWAWAATGVIGIFLTAALQPSRPLVWWALLILLSPLMVRALVGDLQRRHWAVAGFDVSGLGAIAASLGVTASAVFA